MMQKDVAAESLAVSRYLGRLLLDATIRWMRVHGKTTHSLMTARDARQMDPNLLER